MRYAGILILGLGLGLAAWAQDPSKKSVEQPLKHGLGPAPEKFDLAAAPIPWHHGLEAAVGAGKGKPILLFQLLGNFDDTYC